MAASKVFGCPGTVSASSGRTSTTKGTGEVSNDVARGSTVVRKGINAVQARTPLFKPLMVRKSMDSLPLRVHERLWA
jgi:hypothetical protein